MSGAAHPTEQVRRATGTALVLAAVAGYVDAVIYLRVTEVFVANQSGNLILGAMSAAGGEVGGVLVPVVAVLAYIAGAAVAAAVFDPPDRSEPRERARLVRTVVAVVVVLVGCAAALQVAGEGLAAGPRSPLVVGVVAAAAAALGAQATTIRQAGGISVLTTASTGTITSLGVELGRLRGAVDDRVRARAGRLAALVGCYVGGAVLGAALSVHTTRGPELLLVPCVALAAVVIGQRRRRPSRS